MRIRLICRSLNHQKLVKNNNKMKNIFFINPIKDISFKSPSMLGSVIAIICLHGYFIVTAFNSLYNLIICAAALFLLPSPYPVVLKKLLLILKNNEIEKVDVFKLQNFYKKHEKLYLGTGFKWQPRHLRLLQEQLDAGFEQLSSKRHGSFAVHNLELNNRKDILMSVNDLNLHTIVFGTTGAGKTRLFDLLVAQAIVRGDTVIVIDPKSDADLQKKIFLTAAQCSRDLKLHFLNLAQTQHSLAFNPLGTFLRASEIASRITSLMPDSGSAQSFKAHAHSAITAAVTVLKIKGKLITLKNILNELDHQDLYALILEKFIKEVTENLNDVGVNEFCKQLEINEKLIKNKELSTFTNSKANSRKDGSSLLFNLEKIYGYLCNNGLINTDGDILTLISVAKTDPSYYQKVTASVMPCIRTLCGADLNGLLSSEDLSKQHTFEQLAADNGIFYASLNCLSDPVLGGYLSKLLLADLCAFAGKLYTQSEYRISSEHKISVFVDESSEAAGESLVQLLNKSRGADFAVTIATQTFADLVKRTGSEAAARQIIGNCNNKISLRLKDMQTAKIFTESLPATVEPIRSSTISFSESASDLEVNYGVNRSVTMQKCPLFPAEALQYLPDLEFVAALSDGNLVKGRLPLVDIH